MRTLTLTGSLHDYTFNDLEAVRFVSGLLDISEYQVFKLAYRNWFEKDLSDHAMELRFDNYLEDEVVPLWVWDFVQVIIKKHEKGKLRPSEYGITTRVLTPDQKKRQWLYLLLFVLFAVFYYWLLSTVPLK